MLPELYLKHETPVGTIDIPFNEIFHRSTQFIPKAQAGRLALTEQCAQDCIERFIAQPPFDKNAALFLNEMGHALARAQLSDVASIVYLEAFEISNPYEVNAPILAYNFLSEVQKRVRELGTESQTLSAHREWFDHISIGLIKATSCLRHFRDVACYQDGYQQHLAANGGEQQWTSPESMARAKALEDKILLGKDLIRTYNLL